MMVVYTFLPFSHIETWLRFDVGFKIAVAVLPCLLYNICNRKGKIH